MTKVTIYKSNNGSYRRFTCEGHSGFAKSGSDIVCASISILVINTINSLEALSNEGIEVDSDESAGFIDCRFLNEINTGSRLLVDSMILGLQTIEEQYGSKYLRLKIKEV